MNWSHLFPFVCGYEVLGDQVRLYLDWPTPTVNFNRRRGERTPLFRLYGGCDAESILEWLARNKAWQVLRIPLPLTPERSVRAVLAASDWHSGDSSALFAFARDRNITDEIHRQRLQREVRLLIGLVIENPVRDGELRALQSIEDVINVAPVGIELATPAQVVDGFFGSPS